ncbi:hypothetical protein DESC_680017 [Desulfosarcina cetonica]|nr:hypothetical protein DESC_680017 [Desulfosarcina cetonica]
MTLMACNLIIGCDDVQLSSLPGAMHGRADPIREPSGGDPCGNPAPARGTIGGRRGGRALFHLLAAYGNPAACCGGTEPCRFQRVAFRFLR